MRILSSVFFLFLFSVSAIAEMTTTPTTSPVPTTSSSLTTSACPGGISHVTLYRCVCRLNVALASGGQTSIPLVMNGQTTIFSRTELSGSCQGTVLANACNPTAINGANAMGVYSCISVTTTDTGVTLNP